MYCVLVETHYAYLTHLIAAYIESEVFHRFVSAIFEISSLTNRNNSANFLACKLYSCADCHLKRYEEKTPSIMIYIVALKRFLFNKNLESLKWNGSGTQFYYYYVRE